MKLGIVMTVYNRPPRVIANTLEALQRTFPDSPIYVVLDGGADVVPLSGNIRTLAAVSIGYNLDGYNNPAHAFNVGIDAALTDGCDLLAIMSSDCIVQSQFRPIIEALWDDKQFQHLCWTPTVMDMDTGAAWCHPQNVRPFPWFLVATAKNVVACGKYDEEYLKGLAFEDNDFSARVILEAGHLLVQGSAFAFHQSHAQLAYSDNLAGWAINEAYTRQKWGGLVPFNDPQCLSVVQVDHDPQTASACFRVTRRM